VAVVAIWKFSKDSEANILQIILTNVLAVDGRFNSKRFCRDCRRNVLREFKEMKELKRSRKEPQCTRWFCAADTVLRYEVPIVTYKLKERCDKCLYYY